LIYDADMKAVIPDYSTSFVFCFSLLHTELSATGAIGGRGCYWQAWTWKNTRRDDTDNQLFISESGSLSLILLPAKLKSGS